MNETRKFIEGFVRRGPHKMSMQCEPLKN